MIWKDTIKKKKFSYKQKKYPTTAQKKNKKLNRLSAAEREKKEEEMREYSREQHDSAISREANQKGKLARKPFEENHKELLNFLKNDTLIIHNASFDLGFINNELSILGLPHLDNPVVDTVSLAREVLNTRIANLDYLCRRFNIDLSDRSFHGALLDSQLLAAVYLELRGGKQFSMAISMRSC